MSIKHKKRKERERERETGGTFHADDLGMGKLPTERPCMLTNSRDFPLRPGSESRRICEFRESRESRALVNIVSS